MLTHALIKSLPSLTPGTNNGKTHSHEWNDDERNCDTIIRLIRVIQFAAESLPVVRWQQLRLTAVLPAAQIPT